MSDRIPLDHLTSDALDALYERLDAAEETESQRQLATAREALASATVRAARAEAAVARVRALHSNHNGICGWCKGPDDPHTSGDFEYWPCATIRAILDGPDIQLPEFGSSNGRWHWRCNGGQGCDGWVGVDLYSEDAAHREYARHFEEEHLNTLEPSGA